MKRSLLLIFSFCFLIDIGNAQSVNFNQIQTEQSEYDVTIPFEYTGGKIYIPVTINEIVYRFCFDTGCPTMISADLHQKLNPRRLDSDDLLDVNNVLIKNVLNVSLNELSIDKLGFKNIPVTVFPNSFLQCEGFDGIIGSNLFLNSIVRISYHDMTIRITDNRKNIPIKNKYRYLMHLRNNRNTPHVRLQLCNKKNRAYGEFVFDTGDGSLLNISKHFLQYFKEKGIVKSNVESYGSTGLGLGGIPVDTIHAKYLIPELRINKGCISNVVANSASFSTLGCVLIEYGDVTIDYKNKSFALEPYSETTSYIDRSFPIDISFRDDHLFVGIIWDKEISEISIGDQIIEIDGIDYDHVSICDLIDSPLFVGKNRVRMKIKNVNGVIKTIVMERSTNMTGSCR